MFFKTSTVYKAYNTEASAIRYIAKHFANNANVSVKFAGGTYYVVSA